MEDVLAPREPDSIVLPDGIYGLAEEPVLAATTGDGEVAIVTWMERRGDDVVVFTGSIRGNEFTLLGTTTVDGETQALTQREERWEAPYELPQPRYWDEPTPPSPEDLEKINEIFAYAEERLGQKIPPL